MYSYHVLLLPAAVVALVVGHVLLVRKHGVVPPFELTDNSAAVDDPFGPSATATTTAEVSS
jgi:ubiquinol-cytochrome c reductase cytochrome b subunit